MVAYLLLVCIGAVGALGLVAMARIARTSIHKGRAERERLAARERLVSQSNKQVAVPMPAEPELVIATAPRKPARAMTPVPVMPLARGELTGVINLLDQSAQFALHDPPAPPPRTPKASVAPPIAVRNVPPPMPVDVATEPYQRPAWADGVVPKRSRRPTPERMATITAEPMVPMAPATAAFPESRTDTARERPVFRDIPTAVDRPRPGSRPPAFIEATTALDRPMPRVAKASAPPPYRAPSAAPHIAPSQPSQPMSLVRAPSRPPVHHARTEIAVPAPRSAHASASPPVAASGAPATRIPVPPAPIHHAPAGQTRLPVPPLPVPQPRRTRSS